MESDIDQIDMPSAEELQALLPKVELWEEDGEPLESNWHRLAIGLLVEVIAWFLRDRDDIFVGGNMFIYFSTRQASTREYRGPDFFFVKDVERHRERRYWTTWEEDAKFPNVIIELVSPKTAKADRTTKKTIYERTFRTPEYFLYDPATRRLEGWHLVDGVYQAMTANERGWLWSKELALWLGTWEGTYVEYHGVWPRFYDAQGQLVPIRAEAEHQRAETASQRADQQREENARLRAWMLQQGITPPD